MRTLALLLASSLFPCALAPAQTTTTPPASVCTGNYNVVRVSEIKPGMMPTFLKAVEAHRAWYAAAGTPDKIIAMRVLDRDPATKATSYSETKVVTSHIEPVKRDRPLPQEDDAYKAFVDLYKQSSTITSEYHTCMPTM